MTVYENAAGDSFYRTSDTAGDTGEYEVIRATKAELDAWLAARGFTVVGYEKPVR
jgi:hypothetical protein